MKSSSELFPVTLARAEFLDRFADDVYLIKHNLDADRSVQIAVTHLAPAALVDRPKAGERQPLVLVHGAFQNRYQWLGSQADGLACWLVDQGFDVWLMEMRGHGFSPRNADYQNNTAETCARFDIPAVAAFVQEQTGRKPVWGGHSLGGVAVATAVAAGFLNDDNCCGLVLAATQVLKRPWYLWLPLGGVSLRAMMRLRKELDGPGSGMGPENEPVGVVNEYLRRQGLLGKWRLQHDRTLLLPGWRSARMPLLMISGSADELAPAPSCQKFFNLYGNLVADADVKVDSDSDPADSPLADADPVASGCQRPDNQHRILGIAHGCSHDFRSDELLLGRGAEVEVWPGVLSWLQRLNCNC